MCSFNPYLTTAELQAEILARHHNETTAQHENECYSHEVVSTPNGQSYGIAGHIPCDHSAIFYYNDCVKMYGKNGWSIYPI